MTDEAKFQGNHRETAQLLGISEEALRKAVINRRCPVLEQGGAGLQTIYSWPAVIAWRMQDVMPNDLSVERARLAKEQADRTAMENEVRRERLADVDDVEHEWADMVLAFRAKALALGRKLAAQLTNVADPHEIEARINAEIHTALHELADEDESRWGGSQGAPPQRDGAGEAAAESDRQPMGGRESPTQ